MEGMHHQTSTEHGPFSRDTTGLPMAHETEALHLADGDELQLTIAPVANRIGEHLVRMLAYNGSVPGPTLRVQQGSEIVVTVRNDADVEATVHWHGLRLENRYDGVPHDTQQPIPIGGTFTYRVRFPDDGLYWYHPHIREDYTQDSGLYGNIVVEPTDPGSWPPCDREVVLTIDDVLIEDGQIATYDRGGLRPHRDGPVRQRDAGRRAPRLVDARDAGRGRALLPHEHRQHAHLQPGRCRALA